MKIACVSDLHANLTLPMAQLDVGGVDSDRLRDVLSVLSQIREDVERESVDAVVVAGDLFDQKRPDGPTLVRTSAALRELAAVVPVYLLPGNHDAVDRDGRMYTLQMYGELGVPNVRVLGHETIELRSGVLLHAVPWLPEERAVKRFHGRAKAMDPDGLNLIVCHQAFRGAMWDSGLVSDDGIDPGILEDLFPNRSVFVSGHYHRPQWFSEHGMYLGAPLDLRFGDEDVRERGYTIFQLGSKIEEDPISIQYPRFCTVRIDFDGPSSTLLSQFWDSLPEDVGYVRVIVEGAAAELDLATDLFETWRCTAVERGIRVFRVERRPTMVERRRIDVDVTLTTSEMVARYVERFAPAGVDARRLKEFGIGLLSEVGLEGT